MVFVDDLFKSVLGLSMYVRDDTLRDATSMRLDKGYILSRLTGELIGDLRKVTAYTLHSRWDIFGTLFNLPYTCVLDIPDYFVKLRDSVHMEVDLMYPQLGDLRCLGICCDRDVYHAVVKQNAHSTPNILVFNSSNIPLTKLFKYMDAKIVSLSVSNGVLSVCTDGQSEGGMVVYYDPNKTDIAESFHYEWFKDVLINGVSVREHTLRKDTSDEYIYIRNILRNKGTLNSRYETLVKMLSTLGEDVPAQLDVLLKHWEEE